MGFIFNWPHSLIGRTNRQMEFDKYCAGHELISEHLKTVVSIPY